MVQFVKGDLAHSHDKTTISNVQAIQLGNSYTTAVGLQSQFKCAGNTTGKLLYNCSRVAKSL